MSGLAPGIVQFSGRVYATLDPVRRNAGTSLSLDKLTATGSSGVGIATIGKSAGKWYWETTINSISSATADYGKLGVTNILMSSPYSTPSSLGGAGFLATGSSTIGYRGINAATQAKTNFSGTGNIPVGGNNEIMVATDVISTALDFGTNTVSFFRNGQLGCPVNLLPTSSTWYPAYQVLSGTPNSSSVTFNFGQNAWDSRTEALRSGLLGILYTIGLY
jgi:hypothetical protein